MHCALLFSRSVIFLKNTNDYKEFELPEFELVYGNGRALFPVKKTKSSDKVSTIHHAMRLRKENFSASLKEQFQ